MPLPAQQLAGPHYQIVGIMPVSLKNSQPGLLPNPADRIRIYQIISTATSFTLTDGAASNPVTLLSPGAAGSWSFNPPLEVADFQVTAYAGGGVVDIFAK